METAVLQIWSTPKCQSGAVPIAALPGSTSLQITETIGGTDDAGTMVLPRSLALSCGVEEGRVLRAAFGRRGIVEWVIVRVQDADPGDSVTVTLGPLRQLLALRGLVRTVTGVDTVLAFPEFTGTVSEFVTQRVLTNLPADGLAWLSLGTVETTAVYTWPAQSAVRRGECLALVEATTGYEVTLRRLSNDAGYAIDVLERRNSSVDPVLLESPGAALAVTRARDLLQTATAIMPVGEDGEALGEVDWVGGTAIGTGPFWIPLSDPNGGDGPVLEDGQWIGAFLALPGGTTLPIIGSRASDSAVQVASLGAYASGARVVLWDATTGRPVSVLASPSGQAASRGLVVAKTTVRGARAERTFNRNGDFQSGAAFWTPGAQGVAIARSDLNKTITFLANGLRPAGTGTGTPFAIDGLPANEQLYVGDRLIIDGATHTVSADAVPNPSGGLTVSITPNLTATYADDTLVTIVRRERRQWQKNGTLTYSAWLANGGLMAMRDVASDGLRYRPMTGLTLVHDASGLNFTSNVEGITYDSGFSGAFTVNTAGAIGSPPAQFTDGDTFTAVFVRETRGFRFSGTQSSGASSVTFKNITQIARRDWVNTDTLFARRPLTGDGRVTALTYNGGRSFTATIDTALSTIDDVPSADRDNKAELSLPGSWTVEYSGGGSFSTTSLGVTVTSISGTTMNLMVTDATVINVTGSATGTPFTAPGAWTVVDSYAVTAGSSWGSNGRATVTVSIPSGRTLSRGQPLWSNWVGGGLSAAEAGSATPLFVHTAVTGVASSVEVAGWDDYRSDWDGSSGQTTAVYRMFGGTGAGSFTFPGETVVAAANVQASGGGAAAVTLTAANTNAIADNASGQIIRPNLVPAGERTTGSVMRLRYASGSLLPNVSVPSVQSESVYLTVPAGQARTITATLRAVMDAPRTHAPGGTAPQVALVNLTTNQVVAAGSIAASTDYTATTVVTVSATATVTASGLYALRLYGGSSTDAAVWVIALEAQWYVGADVLPYFPGARSRVAFQRAQAILAQRRSAVRYAVRGLDLAMLSAAGTPLVPGQSVRVRAAALGVDTTQRVVRLVWQWPGGELVSVECEALAPRFTDVTVNL